MDKKTFYKLSYGLYVVSSKKEDRLNGQIANTVFQVTSDPPAVAVSINKKNLTCDFIRESNLFSVSILSIDTPLQFIGLFGFKSGRVTDKFSNIKYKFGRKGTPIVIENSLGYLEVEVKKMLEVATHIIFVGEIIDAEILKDGEPLTYAYYHQVKRGATPVTAPTYLEEKSARKRKKMMSYRCKVCGYIYVPEKGDPDSGVVPGTPFEKLPDDWVCPLCGAGKDMFEKEV